MCSGRVDPEFVLRAFSNGMDGVFIGGCRLNECNYVTQGNYDALGMVLLLRQIMERIGLNPGRLNIEFMSAGDGIRLAEVTNDFVAQVKKLGPLGSSEGMDPEKLKFKLQAVTGLVPYIKLVERERLRVPAKSEEAYRNFFSSAAVEGLVRDLIVDKLAMSEIVLLLRKGALSTGEIAEFLGLNPSEVSKHMNASSRQGLVKYDAGIKRFALA